MITVTGHQQKSAWQTKVLPPVEQIRQNVWSIPVPFPDNPLRYTLSYLLTGRGDVLLIDPGWDSDEGWLHLMAGLGRVGVNLTDLTGIIATHYHSDHLGMAARLRNASGAWVAMGEREIRESIPREDFPMQIVADQAQLLHWGVPHERLEGIALDDRRLSILTNLAEPDIRLVHGNLVPVAGIRLQVMDAPGHSPGHVCLIYEGLALIFSGDVTYYRVSPHIYPWKFPGLLTR